MTTAPRVCSVEECTKVATNRGWCSMHYARWQRHGDVTFVTRRVKRDPVACSIDRCERSAHGLGYCFMHYKRFRKHGSPEVGSRAAVGDSCLVQDCKARVCARSYCGPHYRRLRLYGDPLGVPPARAQKPVKGYRSMGARRHPLATADGKVLAHRKALFDKIGPGRHPCHWCGTLVEWCTRKPTTGVLVVDHVDHNKQNNDPDNVVPACNACNGHRLRGAEWESWVPGSPIGRMDRNHDKCRKGHWMVPGNVYRRPDTGRRQCLKCIRDRTRDRASNKAKAGIPVRNLGDPNPTGQPDLFEAVS